MFLMGMMMGETGEVLPPITGLPSPETVEVIGGESSEVDTGRAAKVAVVDSGGAAEVAGMDTGGAVEVASMDSREAVEV